MLLVASTAFAQSGNGVKNFGGEVGLGYINKGAYVTGSLGYRFVPGLYTGLGTGVEFTNDWVHNSVNDKSTVLVPVYAQVKYSFLKGDIKPFVDVKLGLISDLSDHGTGKFIWPSIGVSYKQFGASLGYEWWDSAYSNDNMRYNNQFISFGVSYSF